MEVGLKIKKYLERNGLSQAWLSRRSKIDRIKLNLALNGHRRLAFEEYETICWVLGVGTDLFLTPRVPIGETAS